MAKSSVVRKTVSSQNKKATLKKSVNKKANAKKPAKTAAKATAKNRKQVKTSVKLVKNTKSGGKIAIKAAAKPGAIVAKPVVVANFKSAVKAAQDKAYDFKINDYLVYPTHGVGEVTAIEQTEIAGNKVTLYVLNFEKEKMTLRVPVARAQGVGLRRLSSSEQIGRALSVLKGRPKTARGMWSRRATEYGQKINSGNIEFIAQVVRDLHKNVDDPDRSYSERVIYESAFDRLCGEYAAINKIDTKKAQEILVQTLSKKAA